MAISTTALDDSRSTNRRRRLVIALILLATLSVALLLRFLSSQPDELHVEGSSYLPSASASEWVTYADHVLVIKTVEDKLEQPTDTELERGEGIRLRTTTLEVERVLWSRTDAAETAPKLIVWKTLGTAFKNGDTDRQYTMIAGGRPRIELDHTYVAAVAYRGERCSEGDPRQPAEWIPLGEFATLPYENGVLGQGEFEGREVTPQEMREATDSSETLRDQIFGLSAEALVSELATAKPTEYREIFRQQMSAKGCEQ